MRIRILELELDRPTRNSLAWYGGIGAMVDVFGGGSGGGSVDAAHADVV